MHLKGNLFWWVLTLLWVILIGIVSLLPPSEISGWSILSIPGMDKLLHATFYLILASLIANTIFKLLNYNFLPTRILSLTFCIFYGAMIEVLQPITGRSKSLWDFIADVIGALIGIWLFYQLRKVKEQLFR